MLIGREHELARLDELVEDLLAGRGGALLVRGEAGIGKSALFDALRTHAVHRGARVLWVSGIQSETELAFSALRDLLAPLLGGVDELPAPQSAALASALALGPPQPGDRLAVCVATLSLLGQGATHQPLLAIIDDLPWLDSSSRECVLFAARRASGTVSVLLSARDTDMPPGATGLPELHIDQLAQPDTVRMLASVAPDIVPPVAEAVAEAAAGNPLALIELLAGLEPSQRSGMTSLPVPLSPGPRLGDAYAQRIEDLSEEARLALVVAAAYAGNELRVIGAACAAVGVDVARLAPAEQAGVVRITEGRLTFAHPLVRGAAYHGCPPSQRRSVHAALAGVSSGEQRAWHLGAAALAADENVAAELEAAGHAAMARRGPGPASVALERAARLSPEPTQFARRMLAAGSAATAAALPERALGLLEEAADAATDAVIRASAHHQRGLNLYRTGSTQPAIELLAREAARVETRDPSRAAMMLADAAMVSAAAAQCQRSLDFAEHAAQLLDAGGTTATRANVLAAHGWALVMRGQADRARPMLAEAERLARTLDPLSDAGQSVAHSLNVRLWSGDFERIRDTILAICAAAREKGALSALPLNLVNLAECSFRLSEWVAADAAVAEAVATGEETGQLAWAGYARVIAARLAAARGDEPGVRGPAEAMLAVAEATGARAAIPLARYVLGFLELGLGRVAAAIVQLEELARFTDECGMEEPTLIPWEADLVEAYLRAGRTDDARGALGVMGRRARALGIPPAMAPYARCRGMVEDDFDEHFRMALRLDDERPMPFERARTLLAYGRRLHRAGRRAEAREPLHAAVGRFEHLGATPWITQAQAELRAAGGRRRSSAAPTRELTPPEQRVAAAVARGLTNRQAAAELFLSPKTIEFHLGQLYRKLGISSRSQLAAALAAEDVAAPDPTSLTLDS
jgi:DNA-binding CsgD family transcriptional regulator